MPKTRNGPTSRAPRHPHEVAEGPSDEAQLDASRAASSPTELLRRYIRDTRTTPLLTRDLVGTLIHTPEARKPVHQLTSRQREVLQLLAEGRSMKEAAAILNVSARTVAFHKYRMMEHLHVQTTAALIQFASENGSEVVAEGVETAAELKTLRTLGVMRAQGYFLGRPTTLGAAASLCRRSTPAADSVEI